MLIERCLSKRRLFLKLTHKVRLETAPTEWDQVNWVLGAFGVDLAMNCATTNRFAAN